MAQVCGRLLTADLRVADVEKQFLETQKLAKNLDESAAKLFQHQERVNNRFQDAAQQKLKAHIGPEPLGSLVRALSRLS